MGKSRNVYRILVGEPLLKRSLSRPGKRWDEDDIKLDVRAVDCDGK
jgi:hypothetical protein